ncbi:MAG TPA: DUF6600 domain-containing protein [Candidatus Acidoferrum sp.]|nr:DUF6600 domain-containing protein [Candidatus Acidoferrum sp.]
MFRKHARKVASVLGLAMALALFLPKLVLADEDDPPSVVARLAYSQGAVSFQPAGTEDWVDAGINRPVTTGDKLWSDQDGRVELQLDASTIRLYHSTGFSFLNLNDNVTQVRLTEGTILVRVRHLDQNETYEIDTPNLAFSIYRPGTYRINVDEGGDATSIRVREGEGQVTGGGASYSVRAHDDAVFSGTDQLNADVQDLRADYDEFDSWSANRDRRWEHSRSAQYVSQDVVGYEDLDDHGDWRDTPQYGHVWYPRVEVANWAPYHYGHWAYIEPWGYTWVDDQPWGFAPFHYGRWANVEGRWGWIPSPPRSEGVVYVRPVYAPALVAFVGGGGFSVGISVGGGGGAVGWFPLGPREVYVPSYRVSPRYVENVNISNTTVNRTVINNYYQNTVVNNNTTVNNVTYVNQRVPGAVVATSQQAFTSAQPVARNAVRIDQRQMASAQVQVRQPTIVPTKQAVLGSARPAEHQPPPAMQQRAVVAKAPPPPPPPTFERRQEAIKSNGGRPLTMTQIRQIQPAPAVQTQAATVRVAPPPKQPPIPVREAPKPAQPVNRTAAQGNAQGNVGNRQPGQPQNTPAARPGTPNNDQPGNRPAERGTVIQPNAVQPNNRPGDRPVTQPNAVQPNNRPVDRPVMPNVNQPNERPNTQPTNRPGDRPVTQPNAVQPNNRPADRPVMPPNANQPNERPNTQPTNRPGDRPVNQPNNVQPNSRPPAVNDRPPSAQPNNRPADRPADRPVTQPNNVQPNNRPADRPAPRAEQPAARPAPAPAPAPRPAERPVERPAPRPEQPAARPAPAPAPRPVERPAERPAPPPPAAQRQQQNQPPPQKDKPKDKDKPPNR